MAFGHEMQVVKNDMTIVLGPLMKDQMGIVAKGMGSMRVAAYTAQIMAQTYENEIEWYDKNRTDKSSMTWGIFVSQGEVKNQLIGVTGLHNVDYIAHSCNSGIMIFDRNYWGKGVASASHLMRTLYAADELNRFTITSKVRTVNDASWRALEGIGYIRTGTEIGTGYRHGEYLHSHLFTWINPYAVSLLFTSGLPTEYVEGIKKAQAALDKARIEVTFL